MSMAERKMDSTWLCLSSYEGKWDAIKIYDNINFHVNVDYNDNVTEAELESNMERADGKSY